MRTSPWIIEVRTGGVSARETSFAPRIFLPLAELKATEVSNVRWWIAGISATLSAVAIMYAAGQVKSQARRRWFVIGMTLLVTSISILVFPRWAQ